MRCIMESRLWEGKRDDLYRNYQRVAQNVASVQTYDDRRTEKEEGRKKMKIALHFVIDDCN